MQLDIAPTQNTDGSMSTDIDQTAKKNPSMSLTFVLSTFLI